MSVFIIPIKSNYLFNLFTSILLKGRGKISGRGWGGGGGGGGAQGNFYMNGYNNQRVVYE